LTGAPGALILGPSIGISAGLLAGGLFSVKHYTLRVLIWALGDGPVTYVAFLNESAGRLFLYRVGGGYMFIHRLLLDYFASVKRGAAYTSLSSAPEGTLAS
jgi:hypothetical protein